MNAPAFFHEACAGQASIPVTIVLLDGVSLTTVSAILDPLHRANSILQEDRFTVRLVSLTDRAPVTDTGISIPCGSSAKNICTGHARGANGLTIICGGQDLEAPCRLQKLLRALARRHRRIFAIGAASGVAALAGVIGEGRCSTHWAIAAALSERFPDMEFERTLFSSNGPLTSCAGEFAAFDLIVEFIEETCGAKICADICNHFLAHGRRSGGTAQLLNGDALICDDEKFQHAIQIMSDNLEDPLSGEDLAEQLGIGIRQLQRIFARNGFEPPLKYYQTLRLVRAQQLVEQTRMPIAEICFACGFESLSTFRRRYRQKFGTTPREGRRTLRA